MRLPRPVQQIFDRLLMELRRVADTLGVLHTDAQQQIEATRTQQEREEQKQYIAPHWIHEIVSKYQEAERDKTARDERHYSVQRSLKRATWCAFFAASFYGAVAAYQAYLPRHQLYEMTRAANETAKAANAAVTANNDAPDRFRQDERPYIWLTNDLGQPSFLQRPEWKKEEGGYIVWDWHFTNYGKSPAYNITFRQGMTIGDKAPTRNRIYSPYFSRRKSAHSVFSN